MLGEVGASVTDFDELRVIVNNKFMRSRRTNARSPDIYSPQYRYRQREGAPCPSLRFSGIVVANEKLCSLRDRCVYHTLAQYVFGVRKVGFSRNRVCIQYLQVHNAIRPTAVDMAHHLIRGIIQMLFGYEYNV